MKRTTNLKSMLASKEIDFLMEAHNGLSAVIVEQTGFKGIWASGLSISASLGLRDNNEASWTQVLDVCQYMTDACNIPILLDADTGYGNFNNVRRLTKKACQIGLAGICIEDKTFPKMNSFINGENQTLEEIDTFCGKIKAAKDHQLDDDFVVVARTESLVVGQSHEEALKRAEAYRLAGADAILVHSKRATCDEIDAFMAEWADRSPIVIVPTKYYNTPTEHFREMGISLIIWANHNLRSSIRAMQTTSQAIFQQQSLTSVEDNITSLEEVFRLQDMDELAEAELKYFAKQHDLSL